MSSPLELVLSRLADAKRCGKGWQSPCPAHDDGHPSLTIAEGSDGRVLVKCHAGCTVEAICAAVGLRIADLMPADSADVDKTPGNPGEKRVVSTSTAKSNKTYRTAKDAVAVLERQFGESSGSWIYHDAQGEPVCVIVRWDAPDGKVIRPVARNGEGWVVGGMPEPRPLYRQAELGGAKRVYVTEAEKAADAARSIGLIATTSPHGSRSAEKADWSPLAGKEIIILPDNDDAGREYAKAVATILGRLKPASRTKVLELADLPEGGDVFDWLEQRDAHDPHELRHTIEKLADEAAVVGPKRSGPAILPWRPFSTDILPEPVRGFVKAAAKAIGCDPCYVALPLFSALASAIGATRRIRLKHGWTEPSVIWTAIVGESGTLKSPAMSCALAALQRLQAWKLEEHPELLAEYERGKVLYEADLAHWKRKGRNAGEPLPEKPEEPVIRRYLVDDITIEALADRLQHAPRGLLAARDELSAWLGSFDQYRSGRGSDVARWLSIHRAEMLLVDRKSGPLKTIFIKWAAVSVTGSIPPQTLSRALGVQHFEDGLAARLLLASPPRHGKRWTEATVDPELTRQIEVLFGRLLALDFGTDANDTPAPIDLPLTADGKAAWVEFYNDHARAQENLTGPLAAAYSKIEGLCCSFGPGGALGSLGQRRSRVGRSQRDRWPQH